MTGKATRIHCNNMEIPIVLLQNRFVRGQKSGQKSISVKQFPTGIFFLTPMIPKVLFMVNFVVRLLFKPLYLAGLLAFFADGNYLRNSN